MQTGPARQLPNSVLPEKYRLSLSPDLQNFTFEGRVDIDVQVQSSTSEITLNAAELTLREASLTQGETRVSARSLSVDEDSETATITLDSEAAPGPATLSISYQGILNDQLKGFYRSRYQDANGNEQYLATTQFEATDARRALPCWDEPALKSTFQVSMTVPSHLTAVSNTPVVGQTEAGNGLKTVSFAETPRMSTYLLAFIVGDLASVEAKAPNGTLMRVFATRGNERLGQFALDTAIRLLEYYNDYFGIPYPLEKLDHFAIPDFAAGAMENWGAITYREVALLFDPENSAAPTRQRIVEIIAHEMAHMWFGDLVTMDWWDDLWLNESFASWMGNKATDALYPEWSMWTQFLYQDVGEGLRIDALRNSHPIEANVKDPGEIREIFDAISYNKGASILWMLEQYLGEDTFRNGLRSYLSRHMYGNARGADLWQAMEDESGQPVISLMDSWIKQTGFPVLTVETSSDGKALDLTQERFLYDRLAGQDPGPATWKVPVSVITSESSPTPPILMETARHSFPAETNLNKARWTKVNPGQNGFYRVRYSPDALSSLIDAVASGELPPTDRLGLQSDLFALVRAGMEPATRYLDLVGAYKAETDATVWTDLSTNLRQLEVLLADHPSLDQLRAFNKTVYEDIASRLGWDESPGEGHLDALLRTTVLARAGGLGNESVLEEARNRFQEFLRNPDSLRADIRGVVYSLVALDADRDLYDTLWDMEKKATLQEEKRRLLGAVSRPRDPVLLQETLERSISDDVRAQDTPLVIISVAANRFGRDLAWDFVKENWSEFDRRYGKGGFMIMRMVSITEDFNTMERANEVEAFFQANPVAGAQRTVQQSLESIRLNARWLELNANPIAEWLHTHTLT